MTQVPIIVDDDGWVDTDWEYVELGLKEGWLQLIGHHYRGNDLVMRYEHI
jgi:hypothetical protein